LNFINAHIEQEQLDIEVSDSKQSDGIEYRVLNFGINTNIFMSTEQAEALFVELDIRLHEQTDTREYLKNEMSEMEDKIFDLTDELEKSNELIEQLEENLADAI